jgi:hypothetical protein
VLDEDEEEAAEGDLQDEREVLQPRAPQVGLGRAEPAELAGGDREAEPTTPTPRAAVWTPPAEAERLRLRAERSAAGTEWAWELLIA